jgi:hypothetical protein
MPRAEFHLMQAELSEDRATMRYSCPICDRCVEDGPEGLTILHRGDPAALHRGGTLRGFEYAVEQAVAQAPAAAPRLH